MNEETFRPRLLRETAEIALTEIKRFLEPRMAEAFSLRRVSAPLYLPVGSGLNDPGEAVRFVLPATGEEVEIVTGLDRWLRQQLVRYDIAPGFGVFTVMNALRLSEQVNATSSPHIAAWAWQQVADKDCCSTDYLVSVALRLYKLLVDTEAMILEKFPHLDAMLPAKADYLSCDALERQFPECAERDRREYLYLHQSHERALILFDGLSCRLLVWNSVLRRPVELADIKVRMDDPVMSVGGNVFRDMLALQILHQNEILR